MEQPTRFIGMDVHKDTIVVAVTAVTVVAFGLPSSIDSGHFEVGTEVTRLVGTLLIVAVGAYLGARRDLLASLRERADSAESERELRDEQAKAAERARIAREMHDVLAHKVSLIALHAGARRRCFERARQVIARYGERPVGRIFAVKSAACEC